jgi:hypothetical protein
MTYEEQIAKYDLHIKVIEADQDGKNERKDRHGVMDCSADLREIEAEKRGYQKGYKQGLIDSR